MHHATLLHVQHLLLVYYQQPESGEMQENIICKLSLFFQAHHLQCGLVNCFGKVMLLLDGVHPSAFATCVGPLNDKRSPYLINLLAETSWAASIADTASAKAASTMHITSCASCQGSEKGPCSNSSPGDTGNSTRLSVAAHDFFHICNCSLFRLLVVINVVRFLKNYICLDVN